MTTMVPSGQPQHLSRLTDIIQTGQCVLFLGAGVSIDSGAPSGRELADELAAHFFDYEPGTYGLEEVSELVDGNEGRKALNEFLVERFKALTPAGALLAIPLFRWRSIYTVNFDTLVEAAYASTPGRLQQLRPFYSDKDPISHVTQDDVPLYKLHGCLSRANSDDGRLILTQEDIVSVRESRQRLYNRLLDDVSDYTIFYVGFRRHDPDFTRVLLDVEQAVGQLTGLRRSFALQPAFDEAAARRWEQKRVTLIDAPAAVFFHQLLETIPEHRRYVSEKTGSRETDSPLLKRKPNISPETLQDVERNFELIDERIQALEPNVEDFFMGAAPTWGTIAAAADANRDRQDDVLAATLQDPEMDRQGVQFVLIHAEAGSGKTTLLRRIGVELALTWRHIVLALKPYGDLDYLAVERLGQSAEERLYVLVDDASFVAKDLSDFLAAARSAKLKVTVLAASRTNEWREIRDDFSLPPADESELEPLSRREIENVLNTLDSHHSLGLLAGVSRGAQIAAFEARAQKQLLVALREATEGANFDDIVVDEYDGIPSPDGQRAYLLVASLHRFGVYTRASVLHRALGIPLMELRGRVFEPTTKVIVPVEVLGELDHYYGARHQLIAEIVFDRKVPSERRRLEYYQSIIGSLDLGYASDLDAYRKLSRGMNKKLMRDFAAPENRRDVMQSLIELDPSDAFTQQHAAMMEMDLGNFGAAAKHLRQALSLRPGDLSIRDTEGRLSLALAETEADGRIADTRLARAEDLFTRNISRRPDEPFAYKHLAETYVAWSKRQTQGEQEVHYLALAYRTLLDGLAKCSSASMLNQYLGELEESVGRVENARTAFARALASKPADSVTRMMAARLEEREGQEEAALSLLEEGVNHSPMDSELHYRIAILLAKLHPDRDTETRSHFQAAILGPVRRYRPRIAYAAYLFGQHEYAAAHDQFNKLDELVAPSRERNEIFTFPFAGLVGDHGGRVVTLSYKGGKVEFDHGATTIFFKPWGLANGLAQSLRVGETVSFTVGFNMLGPMALALHQSSRLNEAGA